MRCTIICVFCLSLTFLNLSNAIAQNAIAGATENAQDNGKSPLDQSKSSQREPSGSDGRMLPGIVKATQRVTLSVPMNGVLDQILVNEGDVVKAGQAIARLDDRVARASVRLAEVLAGQDAMIVQARQQQLHARHFLDRVRLAHADKAASEHELDEAQSKFDVALQTLKQAEERQEQAKAQLQLEQARLAQHQIVAPFDGTISRIAAQGGESLNSGDPLLQIVNLRQLKVELHIPSQFFGRLVRGESYPLDAGTPVNRPIRGTLQARENMIDAATNTFRCIFLIDNDDESLPAGFVVRLSLPSDNPMPKTALRTR